MQQTIRHSASRINQIVGPMVMVIGAGAAITGIALAVTLQAPAFLALFIPAVLALGGGLFVLRGARRSQLRIDETGFTWCGFVGSARTVRWHELQQLLPPRAGDARGVAIAQLRDGSLIEIRAIWQPAPWATPLQAPDHREAQNALITGHRHWLDRHR